MTHENHINITSGLQHLFCSIYVVIHHIKPIVSFFIHIYIIAILFLKGKDLNEVYVAGNFNNWQKEERYKLRKMGEIWSINLPLEKGEYCYKFLTGDTWLTDPHNKLAENDSFGGKNSLLLVD
ncbi:MAG: glycogen-binding domain-containing protein [Candidatus Omnitrophota bacterium]